MLILYNMDWMLLKSDKVLAMNKGEFKISKGAEAP